MSSLRLHHILALLAVIASGYWLRFHAPIPAWARDAAGGALYVVAVALLLAILKRGTKPRVAALSAFLIACVIEFLQLWRPAWLQAVRRTLPGRLILGSTFSWWDFAPYLCGAWLAYLLLRRLSTTGGGTRGRARGRGPRKGSRG